jgi:hypothetical protein
METMEQTEAVGQSTENNTVLRLPLWRSTVEDMIKDGVEYGQTYEAKFFEDRLKCDRNSMQFGLAVSNIRRELERHGFYLSGRGQNGNQLVILPPASNADVLCSYSRAATDALKRGVILGTNTRLDMLTNGERTRHEKTLQILATKAALINRAKSIYSVVEKHAPKLLAKAS